MTWNKFKSLVENIPGFHPDMRVNIKSGWVQVNEDESVIVENKYDNYIDFEYKSIDVDKEIDTEDVSIDFNKGIVFSHIQDEVIE